MTDHPSYPPDLLVAFLIALDNSDVVAMRKFAAAVPQLFDKLRKDNDWVVCDAAKRSSPDAVRALIELGADIDERDSNGFTGLCWAIMEDRYDVAKALLELGADTRIECALFHVTNVAMARLVLDHGADINQLYEVERMPARNVLSEAVAMGNAELVEFLKSRGAQLPDRDRGGKREKLRQASPPGDYSAEVIAHFTKCFGKPEKRVIREIVPSSDYPVVIHYIPPSAHKEKLGVLFTVGLSRFEMPVPEGAESYRRAELVVLLAKDWPRPEVAIKDPKWAWPIQWLRKIAAHAIESNAWLGARLSTFAEQVPPKSLGPGTVFTAWLLASLESREYAICCDDATTIRVHQLFPLYREEYEFSRQKGPDALMELFAKHNIQEHIDFQRVNTCLGTPK